MEFLQQLLENNKPILPTGAVIAGAVVLLIAVRYIINKKFSGAPGQSSRRQAVTIALSLVGILLGTHRETILRLEWLECVLC